MKKMKKTLHEICTGIYMLNPEPYWVWKGFKKTFERSKRPQIPNVSRWKFLTLFS